MDSRAPVGGAPALDSPAADASTQELRPDVVSLPMSVLIGVATSAPGQSTAVAIAGMVAVSAYASGPAILLSMFPMLASVSNILPLGPALLSVMGLSASGVAGNVLTATLFGLGLTAIAAVGMK